MQEETSTKLQLLLELKNLYQRLEDFEREKNDLETSLVDQDTQRHQHLPISIENQLLHKLRNFRQRLEYLEQEKADLEISLETITDHADSFAKELLTARGALEREVAKRTQELKEKNTLLKAEIQERKKAEADLWLAAKVFEASNEGIFITDANARIIRVNRAYTQLTGYTAEESVGKDISMLSSGRHSPSFYQNMWEAILTVGYWSGEVWHRRKTEEIFPGWLSISILKDEEAKVLHYIGILTDNTHQKLSEERIYHLSHYDALTDLPNRALFQERLEQALKRAERRQRCVALLLIDIDHFKAINDAFGHPVGDALLQIVAQRLLSCLNHENDATARLGGDSYTLMLPDLTSDQRALQIAADMAEKLLASFQAPVLLAGNEVFISASIGIAMFPQDGHSVAELMKNADTAMHDAKKQGRDSYQFFTETMNRSVHKQLTLRNSLRRALERDELMLYYQPQIDVKTEKIIGVEALLRWYNPKLGRVSPVEFIPVAEESGLIIPIGEWVIHTACQQNQYWQQQGYPAIRVAVNLSVRQFYHEELVHNIEKILCDTQLHPQYLELEVTESIAINCIEKTVETLEKLKALNLHLALDDFGTGYSSLSYLKRFSLDTLKIDASFLADIHTIKGAALISAIINMSHSLRMQVVAEGVEEMEQLTFLREKNCDFVQGYMFSPPISADDLTTLLQKQP